MDHDEAPREGGRARPSPPRADRRRPAVGASNARVAAAAKAAADGLRGVRRVDESRTAGSARAPGVGVLFEPVTPVSAPPSSEPDPDPADPAEPVELSIDLPDRRVADPSRHERPTEGRTAGPAAAEASVWNPFRQQRRSDPRHPAARPEISNLHTRQTTIGVNVIATLVHRGRLCHGTAVGSSSAQGRWRAVAEATVAALQVIADEPLPVGVDQVRRVDDDPVRVEVVVTWADPSGEEALVGTALVHDGTEGAVMQATLDALSRRFERLVRTAPRR